MDRQDLKMGSRQTNLSRKMEEWVTAQGGNSGQEPLVVWPESRASEKEKWSEEKVGTGTWTVLTVYKSEF